MSRQVIFLCLILLIITGCGRRDESLAEVVGDVTFCGQPAIAEVLFEPLSANGQSAGRTSMATTSADGRFRLTLDDAHNGAKIGKHRVTIRVQQVERPRSDKSSKIAADKSATEKNATEKMVGVLKAVQLAREVRAGTNQFSFRLTF